MTQHLVITMILFLASFMTGTAGFGFALVSVPLLSVMVSPEFAVPLALVSGYIINALFLFKFREQINLRKLWPLLIGALPGIPVGVYLLSHVEGHTIRRVVGGVVLIYVLQRLLTRTRKECILSPYWAYVTGFSSGILSGATAMSGPPVLIYLSLHRWEKNMTRAALQFFFLVADTFSIIGLAMAGVLTLQIVRSSLIHLPAVIAGGAAGYFVFKRMDLNVFHQVILYLLLAAGILLLVL